MAPGQYGNKVHPRLYLIVDPDTDHAGGTGRPLREAPQLHRRLQRRALSRYRLELPL
jgi:hypothetical protein